jgi:CheY-like chemotaxis protein
MAEAGGGASPSGPGANAPWAWALIAEGVIVDLDDAAAATLAGTPSELRGCAVPAHWLPPPSNRLAITTPTGPQELLLWQRNHIDPIALSLARGLAHGINNLLTPLMAEVERNMPTRPPQPGRPAMGTASVERLAELARSAAALGRSGDASLGVVDLGRLVEEVAARLQASVAAVFALQVPEGLPKARADLGLMSHVLEDLLRAAALDSPIGAIIDVSVRVLPAQERVPAWLEISIADRGAPVAPERLGELFQPYCRLRPGSDGMARALAAHRMTEQGGRAQVAAGAAGLRWSVIVPCSAHRPNAAGPVLVYDDDPSMLAMMIEIVALSGHPVVPAADLGACVAAMRRADRALAAAVVGVDTDADVEVLLGRLRTEQSGLPLVLLGGRPPRSISSAPLEVLPKPFDVDQLLQALARVIPRMGAAQ